MHLAQDSPFSVKEGLCPTHSMQMEDFCPFPLRATRWKFAWWKGFLPSEVVYRSELEEEDTLENLSVGLSG